MLPSVISLATWGVNTTKIVAGPASTQTPGTDQERPRLQEGRPRNHRRHGLEREEHRWAVDERVGRVLDGPVPLGGPIGMGVIRELVRSGQMGDVQDEDQAGHGQAEAHEGQPLASARHVRW